MIVDKRYVCVGSRDYHAMLKFDNITVAHLESFCVARFLHYDQWGNSTSQNVGQMLLSGNSDVSTQSWVLISEKMMRTQDWVETSELLDK